MSDSLPAKPAMTTTTRVLMFLSGTLVAVFASCGLHAMAGLGQYCATTWMALDDKLSAFLGPVVVVSVGTFPLLTGGLFVCIKAVRNSRITERTLRHLAIAVLLTVGIHLLIPLPAMGTVCLRWVSGEP